MSSKESLPINSSKLNNGWQTYFIKYIFSSIMIPMDNNTLPRSNTYILIPAYKPDHIMIELLTSLKYEGFDIVLVNDGSGEEYNAIFEEAKQYALVLSQDRNRGKGSALRYGFSYINLNPNGHKYVITCDSDGQHAVKDIVRINDKLNETNNVVFGCRKFDKSVPKRSRNGNFMSRLCRTLVTKDYIGDDQCGLRGFPIDMLFNLVSLQGDHYEYEMNVVCTLQIKKIRIEEVPIETIYLDGNKSSHFKPNLDTFRIQRTIWINALVPLVCALLSISMLLTLTAAFPNFVVYASFLISYVFYFEVSMGLTALVWPTRKMARRVLIEGTYSTIKTILVGGLFIIFYKFCHLWPAVAYTISLVLIFLCNFPLAYIAWKIKMNNIHRK